MASPVGYQPFCPTGAALNVIGERWALLVVRDLLLGPRRYSELRSGLGGVGTDILAARLRSLQDQGIVRQVGTGRARRYELTESGYGLRAVMVELARWGADRIQLPDDRSQIPPRVPLTSLLMSATKLPRKANGLYTFRVDSETVPVEVAGGQVRAAPDRHPSTSITLTMAGLAGLIIGLPTATLVQRGDVSIVGDHQGAEALLGALSAPPILDGLRRQLAPSA